MTNSPRSSSDPTAPPRPASASYELLARPVQEWIWRSGWDELRDIQEQAIPLLLRGDADVIIAAATASGKTEAAFVPLLSRLAEGSRGPRGFELLYVSPLKALINDQFRRLEGLCEALDVPVHRWHGDVAGSLKTRAARDPRGVLLITPESLEAIFARRGLEAPGLFAATRCVIVDELHSMLDTERGVQLASLLRRLEAAVGRRVRRVGLSATLGDMHLAGAYLRPDAPRDVQIVRSASDQQELKLLLKGLVVLGPKPEAAEADPDAEEPEETDDASARSIAAHLFRRLRGRQNLVFADSREQVERYADRLRQLSENARLPNEFYAHHSNLAREHREFVETRLKRALEPTTAVCTSTLELGIDIGEVESIAQIGPPLSVASTRQRLGRSGRRKGTAAILRAYVQETELRPTSHPLDTLRLRLMRSIAIFELLIAGWCEPPKSRALHLSTLVQQILSVIAERGGAKAKTIFGILGGPGPFSGVSAGLFAEVLRCLGDPRKALLEQAPDGTLLLGARGERLVEHYGFYAVFMTPEEYRVTADGRTLGTLPVLYPLIPDTTIIFAGKRWRVLEVDVTAKVIEVKAAFSGNPPKFAGSPGAVHDHVAAKMRALYGERSVPAYLDAGGRALLAEGRATFRSLRLAETALVPVGEFGTVILPWKGTAATETLALALLSEGLQAAARDHLAVEVDAGHAAVTKALRSLASKPAPDPLALVGQMKNLEREKYHPYLHKELLRRDAAAGLFAAEGIPGLAADILGRSEPGSCAVPEREAVPESEP